MARIWGGIILGSRTDLHVQSVTMTGHIYRDVILEQHVGLFQGAMGAEILFMDDNARLHRANIVDECLQSEDIPRMDWPAYSPDLNPIEHVWDMLGRRIAARQPPPTCLPELRRALCLMSGVIFPKISLQKGRRRDLLELAETLGITIQDNFKILDIKDAILNSEGYDAEFTCECLNRIISDRKELELRAEREKENQRQFELQKLQITTNTSTTSDSNMPKLELQKLLPIFDPKTTDITIYLHLFERQLTFLKVPIQQWVVYLVGLLPTEVSNLITKESFADAQDYYKVKQILLKRFKLSAEKFRQMFSRHTKDPVKTWRDFYFDLQTYFDGWLKESKVTTLEELKDLIVADQIKKKTPQDYKDHFLDQWCNWNNPLQLVDKLDSYEEVKNNKNFIWKQKEMNSSPWRSNYTQNPKLSYEHSLSGFPSQSRRETGIHSNSRRNPISKDRIPEKKIVDTKEDRTPVSCYGCGAPGIIRSRCHTCNPVRQKDDALSSTLNQSNFYSFSSESNPISIIQISICNTEAAVCADTDATHSVAGEKLYHLLKQK
ncbi:retrovirus-related Pol polyprotein from transposon 297 [Trichonephila clavipes]|nr:retrovirus-related Pol polyprotein from transposon 297 [Trichonephila clavipes]